MQKQTGVEEVGRQGTRGEKKGSIRRQKGQGIGYGKSGNEKLDQPRRIRSDWLNTIWPKGRTLAN